ncbi:MAG: hypothetical protein JSS69_00820 [Acidobacteria bacterium]|nr:hypothetical protein [Acidobacteriota bacterium]MBS1864435.1 hypothetical protein [Acidobacteriota bacterium]
MADGVTGNSYSSKSLLWMTVGLFGAMGVLLGGSFFLAGRVMRSAGLVSSNDGKTMHTPLGSLRIEREKQIGPILPVYPTGSLVIPDQHEALKEAQEAKSGITRTVYQADDDPDLVDHWYQEHLTAEFKRRGPGESLMPEIFKQLKVSESTVAFAADRNGLARIVTLIPNARGVQISLIRFDQPGAIQPDEVSSPSPATTTAPADSSAPAQSPPDQSISQPPQP